MASYHVAPLETLVEQFEKLPGIGHKTAQRLAYHILSVSKEEAEQFASAIVNAHEKIHYCKVCCNLTDQELCPVCRNNSRDKSIIYVVEDLRPAGTSHRKIAGSIPAASAACPALRRTSWTCADTVPPLHR